MDLDFGVVNMYLLLGVAVYFIGYYNGRRDGTDWAVQQVREINDDLRAIYKLMEEHTKSVP